MQSNQFVAGTIMLVKAGLTGLSGAATTFTTGVALTFAILGKAFTRAAFTAAATPVVDGVTGKAIVIQPGTGTVVMWCVDAAGNLQLVQGSAEVLDKDSNGFASAPPSFPLVADNLVPFAYSIHRVAAGGAAFTIGVSQWAQASSFHAAQDIITIPGRPQTS